MSVSVRKSCRVFLLAGSVQQARDYCREHGMTMRAPNVVYVSDVYRLMGHQLAPEDRVVRTGTYWLRPDFPDIEGQMRLLEARRSLPSPPPDAPKDVTP